MKTQANKKKRVLGKGLDALMNDANSIVHQTIDKGTVSQLPINSLQAGASQPRKDFDDVALENLSQSIEEHGVLQPLLVRSIGSDLYEIIAGERRFRASQRAGLRTVPVVVLTISDTEASEIALVENIQREDLNAIEEAVGFNRMMTEFSYTQEMLSKTIGKSRSHIANTLRLLSLPEEVKSMVGNGVLSAGHARTLVGADNAYDLAQEIVNHGMSVRQAEHLVASNKNIRGHAKPSERKTPSNPEEQIAQQILEKNTGLNASVKIGKNGQGKITLSFANKAELDALLRTLN